MTDYYDTMQVCENGHKCGKPYPWTRNSEKVGLTTIGNINEFDIQVLTEIVNYKKANGWMATQLIALAFGEEEEYGEQVKESTSKLLALRYIKGPGDPDPEGTYDSYATTPSGKQYLKEREYKAVSVVNLSGINHSNISINSQNIIQKLNVTDEDIQKKISELEDAINHKNPSKIKKIFGYIADKAVDVAIGILINGMAK